MSTAAAAAAVLRYVTYLYSLVQKSFSERGDDCHVTIDSLSSPSPSSSSQLFMYFRSSLTRLRVYYKLRA